jgi:hypothetical protein
MSQTHRHIDLTVSCVRFTTTGWLTLRELRLYPVQGNIYMRQPIAPGNEVDPGRA